jgi:hypothetical protein
VLERWRAWTAATRRSRALAVDLVAVVTHEGRAQEAPVQLERLPVVLYTQAL